MYRTSFQFIYRTLMFAGVLNFAPSGFAQSQSFSYGGRMVDDMGLAVVGPVDVTLHFFSDPAQPEIFNVVAPQVALTDGMFNVAVTLSPAQVGQLQLAPSLAIQVKAVNTSNSFNKTYPMQIVASVPRALSVPVDNVTLKYVGGVLTSVSSAGPTGPAGATGATGPTGLPGPAGATGAIGPAGPAGANGLAGPTGQAGATGATGPTGLPGPAGATGATGAIGPAGPAGPSGVSGYVVANNESYEESSGQCGHVTEHVQIAAWILCPAGKVAVGGGGQCQIGGGRTLDSYPTISTTTGKAIGWSVHCCTAPRSRNPAWVFCVSAN